MPTLLTAILAGAAIVQAVSAAFVVWLTRRLVCATNKYAETAERLLKLNREQFERDWHPDLRIADIQRIGAEEVYLRVANLARPAALVKQLKIGTGGRARENWPPQDVDTYSLTLLVPGGEIRDRLSILRELVQYREKHNAPRTPSGISTWVVSMSVALVYDSAGSENQTQWIECTVHFSDLLVTSVTRPD